ncbi:patatin-like phospholipase [Chlorella virus XW01]|nr:patatin-like phospholipase [Chlorella virus XW01]
MIDTLILSGGGLKGLGYIGGLKMLENNKIISIKKIKNYYANSVGTIISLLLAIGYNFDFLEEFIIKFDFKKIIPKLNLSNIFNNLGISNGNEIMIIIQTMFLKKTKVKDMTFKEFYNKYNIKLNFITTNYTFGIEEVLSIDDTPDLSVLLAVRMSISIPLIFTPVIYNNNMYIDGFLSNNFPINKIDIERNNYIAINITKSYNNKNPNILEYMKGCIDIAIYNINKNQNNIKNNKIININFDNVNETELDNENIINLNNHGKNIIEQYLNVDNTFLSNLQLFNYIETFTKNTINNCLLSLKDIKHLSS